MCICLVLVFAGTRGRKRGCIERPWTIEQRAVVTIVSQYAAKRDAKLRFLLLSGGHGERSRLPGVVVVEKTEVINQSSMK